MNITTLLNAEIFLILAYIVFVWFFLPIFSDQIRVRHNTKKNEKCYLSNIGFIIRDPKKQCFTKKQKNVLLCSAFILVIWIKLSKKKEKFNDDENVMKKNIICIYSEYIFFYCPYL